jgi:hypothetical protein
VGGSTVIGNTVTCVLMWWTGRQILKWPFGKVLATLSPGLTAGAAAGGVGLALRTYASSGLLPAILTCVVTGLLGLGASAVVIRLTTPKESDEASEGEE